MNFFVLNLRAFKKIFLLLFVATFVATQVDQSIAKKVEETMRGPDGFSNAVFLWGVLSLVCSLVFPALLTLLSLFALTENASPLKNLARYFKRHINQLMIESLRCWGKILQWSFLAIIPGLIKYYFFSLVPYVVVQSKVYDRGETDALELSTRLVKKNVWKILALVLVFHIFIPLVLTSLFDEYRIFRETPIGSLVLTLLDTYLLLVSTQCFLMVFQKSIGREVL